MKIDKTQSQLQTEGWAVVTENGYSYVYRHGTRATVFPFEDVSKAWEWLKAFLKTI